MNQDQPPDVPISSQPVTTGPAHATAPPGHETISALLKQTRPWVLLIAVLVAIGAGLTLLGGFAFAALVAAAPEFADLEQMPRGFGGGIVLLYLVFGAVYLVPSIWYSGIQDELPDISRLPIKARLVMRLLLRNRFGSSPGSPRYASSGCTFF